MMITKETFVNIMNRLEKLDTKMDNVDAALKQLSFDFCGFYVPECIDIVMDTLVEAFNDKGNEWISYCVYELNFLKSFKPGMVLDENKTPIDLSSWDKVYDFLIENMEE